MDNSPRKTWITPQVFVLGAENTEAYGAFTQIEIQQHLPAQTVHLSGSATFPIAGSQELASGYQS
jgi:hypothetical protein